MRLATALCAAALLTAGPTAPPSPAPTPIVFPSFDALPGLDDPAVAELWRRALAHEARREFEASAAVYEELAARLPKAAEPRWRAAKSHWDWGLDLPEVDTAGRERQFQRTREWAARGLEVNPHCGECYLYRAAGIGGALRAKNALAGALQVEQVATALERGIEILASQPDAEQNPELEELYYAAAQLYRSVPDWGALRWALRVPGDRRRAVEYMRRATVLADGRADYAVELGALLFCTGENESDTALVAEGFEVLHGVVARPRNEVSEDDRRAAEGLLARPAAACDFSR